MPSLLYPSNASEHKNVLLIDSNVKDSHVFSSSVNDATFPIIYSSTSTKTELLSLLRTTFTNSSIDRIGVVFSNEEVSIKTFLDSKPFFTKEEPYSENVDFIISVLKEFSVKNIDYLACDTLNYPDWVNYYALLTKETGVIVGASDDKTGNIKYGGDWIMESTCENIEVIYFSKSIEYYRYLLGSTSSHTIAVYGKLKIINNKNAYYAGSSPFKPETMSQGSFLTNSKHTYTKKGGGGNSSSSDITAKKRLIAVGKNTTRIGISQGSPSSYASISKNDVKTSLAKVRGGGSVSPAKKGFHF